MTVKPPPKMTLPCAKAIVRVMGFSLTKRDGEYRLAPYDGRNNAEREACAHYTNDIHDAIATARAEYVRNGARMGVLI